MSEDNLAPKQNLLVVVGRPRIPLVMLWALNSDHLVSGARKEAGDLGSVNIPRALDRGLFKGGTPIFNSTPTTSDSLYFTDKEG